MRSHSIAPSIPLKGPLKSPHKRPMKIPPLKPLKKNPSLAPQVGVSRTQQPGLSDCHAPAVTRAEDTSSSSSVRGGRDTASDMSHVAAHGLKKCSLE